MRVKLLIVSMTIALVAFFLTSCNPSSSKTDALKKENDSLKKEISALKKEVEDLKFGSGRLLEKGKLYFRQKKFLLAKSKLETLVRKYPDSEEAAEAKAYAYKADLELKKAKEIQAHKDRRIEKQRQLLIARAANKMSQTYDEVEKITWYKDTDTPKLATNIYLYFGKKKGMTPWLRLYLMYTADDWLFVNSFIVLADEKKFEKSYAKFERDNGSGIIWEWHDNKVSGNDMELIKAVINSKKTIIRFTGTQYFKDHIVSEKEKQRMRNVLNAFESLGGKM